MPKKYLKKVVELDDNFAKAHKDLGVIFLNKRLFDYAKIEFEKARSIEPENLDILFECANYYHATGEYEIARELYENLLEKAPINIAALVFNALNYDRMNNQELAIKNIEKALSNCKIDNMFLMYSAGKIYFSCKNFEKAKEYLINALELEKNDEVLNLLALSYFELQDFQKSIDVFENLLKKNPMNTNILISLAKTYEKAKNIEKCEEYVNKALEVFPDLEEAHEIIRRIS